MALLVAFLVFGAAGCGGVRLVYDRLDTLLGWYLLDYVDLESDQRQSLERSLDALLAWHRESQAGRYASFFQELGQAAAEPLGLFRIEAARRQLDGFWLDILREVTPEAAALLATLTDAQVEDLFANIERKDRESAAKALGRSAEERAERRRKSLTRQIERWVGPLSPVQQARVAECARGMSADPADWIESRRRWQAELRAAMAYRGDRARFEPRLGMLLAEGERFWTEDYRRSFTADRDRVIRLLADLDASLSPQQRSRLRQRLVELALDFESIAGGA